MRRNKPEKPPEPEKVGDPPPVIPPRTPDKYLLVGSDALVDLVRKVNDLIEADWKPLGGPVFSGNGVLQAMTKD